MGILKSDIKLMASERLTDFHDGGGRMTGNEITSGELNNLFPDISRLDRVYGRVSLRKFFPSVMTDNVDMYYGSHVIVTDPPEDDNVFVTMFTRNDFDDVRDEAKDRIESYVSIAHELPLRLLNDQLEGQRAISCFCNLDSPLPKISDTIVLKNTASSEEQYFRITDISSERQAFVKESYGNYTVLVVTISLSAALQNTFPGTGATPYYTSGITQMHATVVADASNYYGVSKVTKAISQGDLNLSVDSIYNQLVPTSQIETPLVDQLMGGDNYTMHQIIGAHALDFSVARSSEENLIHTPTGIMPGSLRVTLSSGYQLYDVGGVLKTDEANQGFSGIVDYRTGLITINSNTDWDYTISIKATPAVAVVGSFVTREIYIELANRAFNYVPNLTDPLPKPGSIVIDYMAQGGWYRLRDNGNGVIYSDQPNTGTGTIDYATGSMILTVGALPDVGSSIIISWGHGLNISNHSSMQDSAPYYVRRKLDHEGVKPGSVVITWGESGEYSLTDNGEGDLSGDGIGVVAYSSGELLFMPEPIGASSTVYQIDYEQQNNEVYSAAPSTMFTLPNAPIRPGSVRLAWSVKRIKEESADGNRRYIKENRTAFDDGNGALRGSVPHYATETVVGAVTFLHDPPLVGASSEAIGAINYETGEVSLQTTHDYLYLKHYTTTSTSSTWQSRPKVAGGVV